MSRTRRFALAFVLPLLACGGSGGEVVTPGTGPLKIGVIAGNNQSAGAGTAQLPAPVVGQLVRLPDGTTAMRWLDRAGDLVLPSKAYAQGTVIAKGSPVPGAVVCAAPADPVMGLTPIVACANTASDGTVAFAFKPGTVAGQAVGLVQGMQGTAVVTFDTVKATVLPGAPASVTAVVTSDSAVRLGQVFDVQAAIGTGQTIAGIKRGVFDQYGNVVPAGYTLEYQTVLRSNGVTTQGPWATGSSYTVNDTTLFAVSARIGGAVYVTFRMHVVP
jgi:hypothetical protein